MTGGSIIRQLRNGKGLTLKKLSSKIDVGIVYLSNVENDKMIPSEQLIHRLAALLDYKGDINLLTTKFGKIPKGIKNMLLNDPDAIIDIERLLIDRMLNVRKIDIR